MANDEIGGAGTPSETMDDVPRRTRKAEIQGASIGLSPMAQVPLGAELPGRKCVESHKMDAGQTSSDDGHRVAASLGRDAVVGNLAIERRRYEDLCRAHQRLLLQAMATCRYACDGDKAAGAKLYAAVSKDSAHPMALWLLPYFEAMKPLEQAKAWQEKVIAKLARQLPVADWAASVSGLSDRFLGLIVGECGIGPGEYRTVSALWKRMGMAVIEGERQRRVTGDAAIVHGYVARRRSLMWNIGESIIKQQVRNPKGVDGKPLGEPVGIGEYGSLYLERKAYELTKTDKPIIAHSRAKRYMEKRLLRELWKAWRRACACVKTEAVLPVAEIAQAA